MVMLKMMSCMKTVLINWFPLHFIITYFSLLSYAQRPCLLLMIDVPTTSIHWAVQFVVTIIPTAHWSSSAFLHRSWMTSSIRRNWSQRNQDFQKYHLQEKLEIDIGKAGTQSLQWPETFKNVQKGPETDEYTNESITSHKHRTIESIAIRAAKIVQEMMYGSVQRTFIVKRQACRVIWKESKIQTFPKHAWEYLMGKC